MAVTAHERRAPAILARMSRVLLDTSPRRAVVAALILATTTFAACGGDDTSSESAAASSPAAAAQTTPVSTGPSNESAEASGAVDVTGLEIDEASKSSDTPETKRSVRKASDEKIRGSDLEKESEAAQKALEAAGLKVKTIPPFGEAKYALKVDATSILFYGSEELAATDFLQYGQLIEGRPGFSRTAREGHRGYMAIRSSKNLNEDDLKTFRAVRAVVEGGV